MFRLTATLLVIIAIAYIIAGEGDDVAQQNTPGSNPITLTPSDPLAPTTSTPQIELAQSEGMDLPLDDLRGAVAIALAATEATPQTTAPQSVPQSDPAQTTSPQTQATNPIWFVTGNSVNLRAAPSTQSDIVGRVVRGQQAEILAEVGEGWYHIRVNNGALDAYIFGQFLSETQPG